MADERKPARRRPRPPVIRDAFSSHLREMKAANAAHKAIAVGPPRCRRMHLVFDTVRGEVRIKNKLTGTTARAGDAGERAALLGEVGLWLEYWRLSMRWHLAPEGRRRRDAGRVLLEHLQVMTVEGLGLPPGEYRPGARP